MVPEASLEVGHTVPQAGHAAQTWGTVTMTTSAREIWCAVITTAESSTAELRVVRTVAYRRPVGRGRQRLLELLLALFSLQRQTRWRLVINY